MAAGSVAGLFFRVRPEPVNFVLEGQFAPLEGDDFRIVYGWAGECFIDALLNLTVTLLKFRKVGR
jgi:hypothetical protein